MNFIAIPECCMKLNNLHSYLYHLHKWGLRLEIVKVDFFLPLLCCFCSFKTFPCALLSKISPLPISFTPFPPSYSIPLFFNPMIWLFFGVSFLSLQCFLFCSCSVAFPVLLLCFYSNKKWIMGRPHNRSLVEQVLTPTHEAFASR